MSYQHRKRADENQTTIIRALKRVGASVVVLSQQGDGCPDLLVGFRGRNWLLEVKPPGRTLNLRQVAWRGNWQGSAVAISSWEQALEAIGLIVARGSLA